MCRDRNTYSMIGLRFRTPYYVFRSGKYDWQLYSLWKIYSALEYSLQKSRGEGPVYFQIFKSEETGNTIITQNPHDSICKYWKRHPLIRKNATLSVREKLKVWYVYENGTHSYSGPKTNGTLSRSWCMFSTTKYVRICYTVAKMVIRLQNV
jgi:hypothetical protein